MPLFQMAQPDMRKGAEGQTLSFEIWMDCRSCMYADFTYFFFLNYYMVMELYYYMFMELLLILCHINIEHLNLKRGILSDKPTIIVEL